MKKFLAFYILSFIMMLSCDQALKEIEYSSLYDQGNNTLGVTGQSVTFDTTPTWTWSRVKGATKYRYGFTEGTWITETATVLSYTPSSPLNAGVYTLYVQAGNEKGDWTMSGSFSVTISTDVPVVTGTAYTTDTTPTWTWDAVPGATRYRYGFTEGTWITETDTGTSYTPTTALAYGSYTLYVQAGDDSGDWTSSGSFTIIINSTGLPDPFVYHVSDTGQTECSSGVNGDGAMAACPQTVSGQDGNYINIPNARSFTGPTQHGTYTSDYTTKDNVTGLIWKTCSEGQTGSTCTGTASTYIWDNAITACTALNSVNSGNGYAGRTDWRLPSFHELPTIVNYGLFNPAIDTTFFPGTQSSYYWSSSVYVNITTLAWLGDFAYGDAGPNYKTYSHAVRCVSGP